jgi:hypothetical protein
MMNIVLVLCLFVFASSFGLSDESVRNTVHYGDPSGGCLSDEVVIRIAGVLGGICTSHCAPHTNACPMDFPAGIDVQPRCALENRSTGEKFCGLLCHADSTCGLGASCKFVNGDLGICTYDDVFTEEDNSRRLQQASPIQLINL